MDFYIQYFECKLITHQYLITNYLPQKYITLKIIMPVRLPHIIEDLSKYGLLELVHTDRIVSRSILYPII